VERQRVGQPCWPPRSAAPAQARDSGDEDDIPPGPPVDRIEVAAGKLHVDRSVLDEIKQLLDDKGQVVLYGAPGTGKTYLVVELATAIADGEEDRLSVVQFHPATTYEDFFEGLRPAVTTAVLAGESRQVRADPLPA
jgi:5-methylcytosine-specific restriction protein B